MPEETTPQPADWISVFVQQAGDEARRDPLAFLKKLQAAKHEAVDEILKKPREQQAAAVLDALARQVDGINRGQGSLELGTQLSTVLRRKLPFTAADLEQLVRTLSRLERCGWWGAVSPAGILRAVEQHIAAHGMSAGLRDGLEQLAARLRGHGLYAEPRELLKRVETLLAEARAPEEVGVVPFRRGVQLTTDEAWTGFLRSALDGMDPAARAPWHELLPHCAGAGSSKPSGKWLKQAEALLQAIGVPAFVGVVGPMLAEVGKPGGQEKKPVNALGFEPDPTQVHDEHSDLLRGLVWCTGLVEDEALVRTVGDTADACFKKLPGIGPRAPKIGNACLWALSNLSSTAAVAQLSRIKTRAKHASVKKQLGKALDTAAEKTGLSADDLEEIAVPTCGLTGVGEYRRQLGEHALLLRVTDGLQLDLSWTRPDGKAQASVPAAVKEAFPDEVKALKQTEKDLAKLLPAQRDRLERLLLEPRSWALGDFRSRFLDHPLVGTVARRLLWQFTDGDRSTAGAWHDGRIVDAGNLPVGKLGEATRVSLWHPLGAPAEEVGAWREWLEAREVRQPFKQAHREVYVLTDAERQTGTYSNRFAAHLVRQHQFAALCQQRGWRYRLQGEWDSHNTPTLELPRWDLRAEFWVDPVRERGAIFERGDLSHRGIFLFLSTDQVRFYRQGSAIPLPVAEVPPLAFSEVLRDVDLFVGVASIGNDPTWADGGLLGRTRDYWHEFSFGELFPTAQTRKAVLERLVPRLKIAGRCSFTDRFLVVRGELRTYKIHLGSGNILMSPNDLYLCIVPQRGPGNVYLPFEGDDLLSVIVSKALLLAEDTKIKDPTIVSQIRRGIPG